MECQELDFNESLDTFSVRLKLQQKHLDFSHLLNFCMPLHLYARTCELLQNFSTHTEGHSFCSKFTLIDLYGSQISCCISNSPNSFFLSFLQLDFLRKKRRNQIFCINTNMSFCTNLNCRKNELLPTKK